MMDQCGLLISIASTNLAHGRAYFQAGRERNAPLLTEMQQELTRMTEDLKRLVGKTAHMDGAFDKMFCRVHDPGFPLRLLPPYAAAGEDVFEQFKKLLFEAYPRWAPHRS
jgi:hypothetical protein